MKLRDAALACSAIATVLYVNTLDCGFCFDDESAIKENLDIRSISSWTQLLKNDFWGRDMADSTSHKSYRPLTVATFRLNYMLHELEPLGYHLVNVLLHGGVCYLYVLLCGVVFGEVWPALIAGLLFAVHPIHTEAVAGVVGRAEMICSIFYILSIFSYRRAVSKQQGGLSCYGWIGLCLLSILASVLGKEQGLSAVAACIIYDFLFNLKVDTKVLLLKFQLKLRTHRGPSGSGGEDMVKWRGFAERTVVLFIFSVLYMIFRWRLMDGSLPQFYFEETNPAAIQPTPLRQLHWIYLCFVNMWLLINPSSLCADWTNGSLKLITGVTDVRNFLTLSLFLVLAQLLIWSMNREKRTVIFALALLVLPYLPASNLFFPVGFVVAERVLYLPSMGFCMLVASSLHYKQLKNQQIIKKYQLGIILKLGLIFVLLIQSLKTLRRNRDWVSDEILWMSAIPVNPNNAKAFTNLATQYDLRNQSKMALLLSEHALSLQPEVMITWTNVAFAHKTLGNFDETEKYLRTALTLVPEGKKMAFLVGSQLINVYGELGDVIKRNSSRLKEASSFFTKAVSLESDPSQKAHWKMLAGECYIGMDDHVSALSEFQGAVDIEPNQAETNHNLGVMYLKLQQREMGEKHLRRAIELEFDRVSALTVLATVLGDSNNTAEEEEALLLYERTMKYDPKNHKHYWRKGKLHHKRGEYAAARDLLLMARALDPDSLPVLYSLGKTLTELQQFNDAVTVLERVYAELPGSRRAASLLANAYRKTGQTGKALEIERRLEHVK